MSPWRVRPLSLRRLLTGATLALLAPALGCSPGSGRPNTGVVEQGTPSNPTAAEIGSPLYTPVKPGDLPPRTVGIDPVVIDHAPISMADKQEVPSQVDSVVWAIATELKPGEEATLRPDQIFIHPVTKEKYRKIDEGENVVAGQLVAVLDDLKVRSKYQGLIDVLPATQKMAKISEQFTGVTAEIEKMQESLYRQNGPGSRLELLQAQAQNLRGLIEQLDKLVSSLNTKASLDEARVEMSRHMIRATTSGVIRRVLKHIGESVKPTDPIMEIDNPNRVRADGMIGIQYTPSLKTGMRVGIEPEKQAGPEQTLSTGTSAITAVAVGRSKKQPEPLVIASADRRVVVQDRVGKTYVVLPHPVAVRALACSPPAAPTSYCLTGGDDGKLRLWDLNTLSAKAEPRELKGRHRNGVSAVAFSLDGKYCVSGDDQSIQLWDVASGDLKYEFPAMHHGPITMLQFTPQSKLLSTGRDNTLLVWDLGQKGARVAAALEQRSGHVPVLGASADGRQVLFDQSNKLLKLLALPEDQRALGILEASETSAFANFAHFSPDGQLILVGTAAPDRLQLWRTPTTGVRGSSARQYVCNTSAGIPYAVRCAAFSPDGTFAVAGTAEGDALILPMPTKEELSQRLEGVVTLIDTSEIANPSRKQSRIRAELDNPGQRLAAGDVVTIVAMPVK
jgi:hypothetical protein